MKHQEQINEISGKLGVTVQQLKAKSRKLPLPEYRFLIYKWCKKHGMALTAIAREWDKDHTSVIHGLQKCDDLITTDSRYRDLWNDISTVKPGEHVYPHITSLTYKSKATTQPAII